ncbi:MAG: glycosyltransferase family 4 protein [Acidobacteria bacterium]|nr:glycosyltransferase family 4 protein [Acidobacteriota bacterium]
MLTVGIDARELQGRPTGTGRYLRNLLRVWTRTTDDRFIAYFNGPAPADPVLDLPRLVTRSLGDRPARGLVWQERRLPAAARADAPDVFFSPAYSCPLTLDVPRVTAVHDLSFVSYPEDFGLLEALRRRWLVGTSIRASRRVLACSEFTRREILARHPEAAGRVVHVPLGADDDLSPPPTRRDARERLHVASRPFVVTVGAILNRRRLPELLQATARLVRRHPDLILDVVGENRTHPRLDLLARRRALDLEGHVRLSGFVSEAALADRYAAADVAVFLSEYEGFGLPALEAMARGVPVIAADRPSLSEVFGSAALLVDPRDVTGIAAAVDRVLADPALRADLVARGEALAARHSWGDAAARTRAAFEDAARGA